MSRGCTPMVHVQQVKNFKVDRPFEVYLVGLKNMNVLFAAKVVDPSL
jgi:serine protease inhibitor